MYTVPDSLEKLNAELDLILNPDSNLGRGFKAPSTRIRFHRKRYRF